MTTPSTINAAALAPELINTLTHSALQGIYKLELREGPAGEAGGTWYIKLAPDESGKRGEPQILATLAAGEHPDVIVRSDVRSLKAVLEGRMSFSDGLISERFSVVGDMTKIVQLKKALSLNHN